MELLKLRSSSFGHIWPYLILAILFMPFGFLVCNDFYVICLSNILAFERTFCTFSVDHCVVCSSSIYGFWLPLWFLQTLLMFIWRKLWVHETSLTPPHLIEMPLVSQESQWLCICVFGISILPPPLIFLLEFGNVPSVWLFLFFFNFIYVFMMEAFFRKYSTEGSFSSPQLWLKIIHIFGVLLLITKTINDNLCK